MTRPGDWAVREKPREKLRKYGPANLSNEELMQVLLGNGVKGCSVAQLSRRALACLEEYAGCFRDDFQPFLDALIAIIGILLQRSQDHRFHRR